jgi:membrane protease YdiL (CAAX protease family)
VRNSPTVRSANLLYLLVLLMLLTLGTTMQGLSPLWGLIGTQLLLILLPALVLVGLKRLPLRETIRWRWPGWPLSSLSILLGFSILPVALWLGTFFAEIFEYTPDLPPGFFPTNMFEALLLFTGVAILAPVCEELLFRGVIQRPYESSGPWAAILTVGFLFAIFHLSFLRVLALLPVAFLLGYVVWASNSLIPGILLHAAYNTPVALLTILQSFRPDIPQEDGIFFPLALAGLLVTIGGISLFHSQARPSDPPEVPRPKFAWVQVWPLLIALVLFFAVASIEFALGRNPEILVREPLTFNPAPWERPAHWRYQVRNVLDETIGEADCRLTPQEEFFLLDCQLRVQAFTAEVDQSLHQSDRMTSRSSFQWRRQELDLVQGEVIRQGETHRQEARLERVGEQLIIEVARDGQPLQEVQAPAASLLVEEWPWRLSALPFNLSYGAQTTLAWTGRWDEQTGETQPGYVEAIVLVRGGEPVWTPAGNFIAWRVTLEEDRIAWYDSHPPHTLVRLEQGGLVYLLESH